MLVESFPVQHRTLEKLGAGIVIGTHQGTKMNAQGQIEATLYFIVLWENNKMPAPHTNDELIHLVNHEQWFSNYFETDDDNDDDENEDDEFLLDDETEEVIEANVKSNEEALKDFESDAQFT